MGCLCAVQQEGMQLTWNWHHRAADGTELKSRSSGYIVPTDNGFVWNRTDGTKFSFARCFDGVWRCPGWNTFCLTSLGNVKVFQNYEKKYLTPVNFVSDYESNTVVEHYLDERKLSYAVKYRPDSQIMDGLDGNDLGRRFENLLYFDGCWHYEMDGCQCELRVEGARCQVTAQGITQQGLFHYAAGMQKWILGGRTFLYAVSILDLNSYSITPVSGEGQAIILTRAEPL